MTWYEGTGQKKRNELADLEIELKVETEEQERDLRSEIRGWIRSVFPSSTVSDVQIEQVVREYERVPFGSIWAKWCS